MWGGTSRSTQVHIVLVPANQHINQQKPSSNNNKPEGWTIASLVLFELRFLQGGQLKAGTPALSSLRSMRVEHRNECVVHATNERFHWPWVPGTVPAFSSKQKL